MSNPGLASFARSWSIDGERSPTPPPPAPPRSAARRAIERVLRVTPRHSPLSAVQISERCNLDPATVRAIINNIVQTGAALNVTPGRLPALYAGNPRPKRLPEASPPPWRLAPLYDGAELRPYAGRPGAMVAFTLPSLVDGVRVPRRPPMLVGAAQEPRR